MDLSIFVISLLAIVAVLAVVYFIDKRKVPSSDQVPIADLLRKITDEILAANQYAHTRGTTVMLFQECELEISFLTEKAGEGNFTVYAMNLSGGVKRTDSNKITLKYVSYEQTPVGAMAAETPDGSESAEIAPATEETERSNNDGRE